MTRGSQTQLRFLPVPHTDFIFSAFAEEHGFVGVGFMLGLYFVLLMQIVQNAQMAPDRAGMYICMGVGALLLFHILVNIGMVVGRMPVTGIPLPFISFGGSSLVITMAAAGVLINVARQGEAALSPSLRGSGLALARSNAKGAPRRRPAATGRGR